MILAPMAWASVGGLEIVVNVRQAASFPHIGDVGEEVSVPCKTPRRNPQNTVTFTMGAAGLDCPVGQVKADSVLYDW
jgi:hypothetical protein